jgi:hypothetical protein
MKKNLFNILLGGVLVLTTPVLTSCDDILGLSDNPVESNSVLAEALDEGAVVTIDLAFSSFALKSDAEDLQVKFKRQNGKFVLKSLELGEGSEMSDENIEEALGKTKLTYDAKDDQIRLVVDIKTEFGEDEYQELTSSIIVFNLANNTYEQFGYPHMFIFNFKGIAVNGVDKTDQIENLNKKSVEVVYPLMVKDQVIDAVPIGSRGVDAEISSLRKIPMMLVPVLCVQYNAGETWAKVNERYIKHAGKALFENDLDDDADEPVTGTVGGIKSFVMFYFDNNETVKYGDKVINESSDDSPIYVFGQDKSNIKN